MEVSAARSSQLPWAVVKHLRAIAAEPVTGAFNMIDRNGDGAISRQEFAAAMGQ